MPSNNNNSTKNSMSFGKGKNGMAIIVLFLLIVAIGIAYYFVYKSNNEGFSGDSSNLTPESGEVIVALFYAPWCGHCKTFKPHFEKAMGELDGKKASKSEIKGKTVRFAKINCDEEQNKSLAKKYSINGYPTVKILSDDGEAIEYDGERSADGMRKYLTVDN
jgi:protein disulfide-isomerase-like protein